MLSMDFNSWGYKKKTILPVKSQFCTNFFHQMFYNPVTKKLFQNPILLRLGCVRVSKLSVEWSRCVAVCMRGPGWVKRGCKR